MAEESSSRQELPRHNDLVIMIFLVSALLGGVILPDPVLGSVAGFLLAALILFAIEYPSSLHAEA